MPPVLHRAAITPPSSFPIPESDPFPFSDFDIRDLEGIDTQYLFDLSPLPQVGSRRLSPVPDAVPISSETAVDPSSFYGRLWSFPPSSPGPSSSHQADSALSGFVAEQPIETASREPSLPPVMAPSIRKRSAPSQGSPQSNELSKRAKTSNPEKNDVVETIEILGEEDISLSSMVQQQVEHQKKGKEPTKLSQLQCVICLEPPMDLTATHCGA